MTIQHLRTGDGYATSSGLRVHAPACDLKPSTAFPSGQTIGDAFELGPHRNLNLALEVSAKSGTDPTLDVTVQTSHGPDADGDWEWRTVGAFDQKTDVGLAFPSAATEAGTTPPDVTFSGTADRYINFRMECTTLGARGTSVVKYSIDGGVTWVFGKTTAATWAMLDADGNDTGITIAMENAAAAVNNVWTAKTLGFERRSFPGCDRFARVVAQVGGSSTPIMTAAVTGEAS